MFLRIPLLFVALTAASSAITIGTDPFEEEGPIAGRTGGSGFNHDLFDGEVTDTTSDWDNVGGAPSVTGGSLITLESSAKREYNGVIEGVGDGSNDGQDDHERSGALRGAGVVFYKFDITRGDGATWSGISSYDFGAERIFFGVPYVFRDTDEIGIQIKTPATTSTQNGIALTDGQPYTMVAVLDFDNDLLGLFVDPEPSDDWDATGGTADVTLAYTGTNWSTAVRFGSGGSAQVAWDNIVVATTPEEVGLLGQVAPAMPEIIDVVRDSESGNLTITWTSVVGVEYFVEGSSSLAEGSWEELNDSYPAGGATDSETSLTLISGNDFPADTQRLFVRIYPLDPQPGN